MKTQAIPQGTSSTSRAVRGLLLFTGLGVFVEVGLCAWGLTALPPRQYWMVPAVLAFFHSGYLLAHRWAASRFPKVRRPLILVAFIGVVVGMSVRSLGILVVASILFSASLHAERRNLKRRGKPSVVQKSLSKYLGMILSSVFALPGVAGTASVSFLGLSSAAIGLSFSATESSDPSVRPLTVAEPRSLPLLLVEFFHHAHYFAYCYVFWVLLPLDLRPLIGVLFPLGWIGYSVFETIVPRLSLAGGLGVIGAGHLLVAVAVFLMPYVSPIGLLLLWIGWRYRVLPRSTPRLSLP